MNVLDHLQKAYQEFRYPTYGSSGGLGALSAQGYLDLLHGRQPGSNYDYKRKAGKLWQNSIVASCINWQAAVMSDARLIVQREDEEGEEQRVPGHPILEILKRPNQYCDWSQLQAGLILSLDVDGNAYCYKLRSASGKWVGLVYIPHFAIGPVSSKDGSVPVAFYEYRVDGKTLPLQVEDVVHIKDGIDPEDPRKGLSDLGAVLREVCTDNEASTLSAALLANGGVPPLILSPKPLNRDEVVEPFTGDQAKKLAKLLKEKTTGARAGEPLIPTLPMEVTQVAFSPASLILDKMHDLPEERITSALRTPAVVIGLGAGLAAAGDRNLEAMERWAWTHGLIPMCRTIDSQMTFHLMPEISGFSSKRVVKGQSVVAADHDEIGRDYKRIAALQPDMDKLYERETLAVGGPWITRNEARARVDAAPIEGGDELYPPKTSGQQDQPIADVAKEAKERARQEWRKNSTRSNGNHSRELVGLSGRDDDR